jgi:hypothetical protein
VRLEGSGELKKNPMTSSGMEPATFQKVEMQKTYGIFSYEAIDLK